MIRRVTLFALFIATSFVGLAQKKPATKKSAKARANKVATGSNSAASLATNQNASINAPLKLWYDSPAKYFEEALVLGNGQHGATVFGGISQEKIFLNDATLWSGEPVNANMNPNAYKNLPAVRGQRLRLNQQPIPSKENTWYLTPIKFLPLNYNPSKKAD
ncbi:MAG: glycoside hydrolase family 95 protein [Sediminibacterium sp.]|nr:glycoside hydrolase family 95 protein [Sediminibacterium sp.]